MFWLPTGHDSVAHTVSGGLSENGTQKPPLQCLAASHQGMALLEGGVALLEEMNHCRWALRFSKTQAKLSSSLPAAYGYG